MRISESDVGKIVRHKLTKEKVIICGRPYLNLSFVHIRLPDYSRIEVNEEELEELDDNNEKYPKRNILTKEV